MLQSPADPAAPLALCAGCGEISDGWRSSFTPVPTSTIYECSAVGCLRMHSWPLSSLNIPLPCFRRCCSEYKALADALIYIASRMRRFLILHLRLCVHLLYGQSAYTDLQYTGLEALYVATNGYQWTTSSGWLNAAAGVCNWHGVTCDSTSQNVTAVSLPSNNLDGDLSSASELANIASLRELHLSENGLYGAVPLVLGMMPALEVLDLSENNLSSFPSSWGSGASSLRHLSVRSNAISG